MTKSPHAPTVRHAFTTGPPQETTTTTMDDPQLEADLRELRRLAKLRRLLELPADLFSKHAQPGCRGECDQPVPIGVFGLKCCHFYTAYERYHDTLKLEVLQRQRVERTKRMGRGINRIESPLHDAYYRDFTGTHVLRKLRDSEELENLLDDDDEEPDQVDPQESRSTPEAYLRGSLR